MWCGLWSGSVPLRDGGWDQGSDGDGRGYAPLA